jgi:hypothetical protein
MEKIFELTEAIKIINSMEKEISLVGKIRLNSLRLKNTENTLFEIIELEKSFRALES